MYNWITLLCISNFQNIVNQLYSNIKWNFFKKTASSLCWSRCGEKGPLLQCWSGCKLVQIMWRTVWRFLQILKMEPPYDSTILLLGIYPEKTIIWKDACTPKFIAGLFIIVKTWKQPKCSSTDEEIRNNVCWWTFHIQWSITQPWKEQSNAICSNMDWPRDHHTKGNRSDRERHISYGITHMWSPIFKNRQVNFFAKQKQTHRLQKQTYKEKHAWGRGLH